MITVREKGDEKQAKEEEKLSFEETLPHCIENLLDNSRKGLQISKALNAHFLQMHKIETRNCELQLKVVADLGDEKMMLGISKVTTLAHEVTVNRWKITGDRLKRLEEEVLRPWEDNVSVAQIELKAIEKRYKRSKEKRDLLVAKLENTFKVCNQIIHKIRKKQAKMADKKVENTSNRGVLGKMGRMLTQQREAKTEELAKKLTENAQSYYDQLSDVNEGLDKFDQECEHIAQIIQNIETQRLQFTRDSIQKWSEISLFYGNERKKRDEEVLSKSKAYSPEKDIHEYIEKVRNKLGNKPKSERFHYDLPYTLQDIKQGNLERRNSVFDNPLDQVMLLQRESDNPDVARLNVPAIVPVLISAIERLGGFVTEGIFRKSAAKKDLDRLKKQIDEGNYEINERNPHIPAGLLKLWIRHLPESLIPSTLYSDALSVAKKQEEISIADIQKFAEKIPLLNRAIIGYISNMALEVVKFKSKNLMSMNNIAIVFAPGLLQDPRGDAAAMLQNSKYEIKFTVALLSHFPLEELS